MRNQNIPSGAIGFIAAVVLMAVAGCLNQKTSTDPLALNGGKGAAAQVADTQSKSSALGEVVVSTPDTPPQAVNAGKAIVSINGPAKASDVTWARKITASEDALVEAQKDLAKLADANAALIDKLSHSISPEDAQRLKQRADEAEAALDAFSFHSRLAVLAGLLVFGIGFVFSWSTDNPKFAGYGFIASFAVNLIPFIIKAVSESLALKIAIPVVFVGLGGAAFYEWRKGNLGTIVTKAQTVAAPITAPVVAEVETAAKSTWASVVAWFKKTF